MVPMRTSSIFKSRWLALLWAAGIVWFAYDFAAPSGDGQATGTDDAVQVIDATGAPITPDEARQLQEALNRA